MRTRGRHIG